MLSRPIVCLAVERRSRSIGGCLLRMFNRSMLSVFNVSPRRELQQAPLQLRWPRAQTQAQPPGPGPLSSRAPQPPAAVRLFLTVGDEPAHWRATPGSLPMQRFCTRRERGRLVHQAPWRTSAQQRLRRGRHRRHCPPQQQHKAGVVANVPWRQRASPVTRTHTIRVGSGRWADSDKAHFSSAAGDAA